MTETTERNNRETTEKNNSKWSVNITMTKMNTKQGNDNTNLNAHALKLFQRTSLK